LVGDSVAVRSVVAHGNTVIDVVGPLAKEITSLEVVDTAVHNISLILLTLFPRAPSGGLSLVIIEGKDDESR
jgi:hypothetical protein